MAKEMLGVELYPELGGLIQLAYMDRVFFMIKSSGDHIVVVDLGAWEIHETTMCFSDLILRLFEERSLFQSLGESIWHESKLLFGVH